MVRLDYPDAAGAEVALGGLARGWYRFSDFIGRFRGTGFVEGIGQYTAVALSAEVHVVPGPAGGTARAWMEVTHESRPEQNYAWAFRRDASLFVLWGEGRLTGAERRALVALGRPVD